MISHCEFEWNELIREGQSSFRRDANSAPFSAPQETQAECLEVTQLAHAMATDNESAKIFVSADERKDSILDNPEEYAQLECDTHLRSKSVIGDAKTLLKSCMTSVKPNIRQIRDPHSSKSDSSPDQTPTLLKTLESTTMLIETTQSLNKLGDDRNTPEQCQEEVDMPSNIQTDTKYFYSGFAHVNSMLSHISSTPQPILKSQNTPQQMRHYEDEMDRTLQTTLDSVQRSMTMIVQAEAAGSIAAQTVEKNNEELSSTERRLEDIDVTTKQTQRDLNKIGPLFGGFKPFFRSRTFTAKGKDKRHKKKKDAKTEASIKKSVHTPAGTQSTEWPKNHKRTKSVTCVAEHTLNKETRAIINGTRAEEMDNEIDGLLATMTGDLERLRTLGKVLDQNIEQQNDQLDRMNPITDKVQTKITDQNRQMGKLLNKGKKERKEANGHKEAPGTKVQDGDWEFLDYV